MEVADILRADGAAWCAANKGHVGLGQLRAISAIKACRTAARCPRRALRGIFAHPYWLQLLP